MPITRYAGVAVISILFALPAAAQNHAPAHMHADMSGAPGDSRHLVELPPMMQSHLLGEMRDHLQSLEMIVQALSASDFERASRLASERLGLDSPSAAACKRPSATIGAIVGAPSSSKVPPADAVNSNAGMAEMMAQYMPESMRSIGLAMHTAASDFAATVKVAGPGGNTAATMAALTRITESCVACHAAYRVR
jgi:hypothetical protein